MTQAFVWPVRVYYEDTDVSGVVYHANYLKYFERARTEWLRTQGLGQESLRATQGIAFTVANMEIVFRSPARLDDELEVVVEVAQRRTASLIFKQTLRECARPERVLSSATVRVGCVDVLNFKPRRLPEWSL